jgi:glycosyltransferase involved in cell wall biosynthesis
MLRCKRPKIVLPGFIFTEKQGAITSSLNKKYFSWTLQFAETIICHSSKEVGLNNQRFPHALGKFVFFPYGTHVWRDASPVDTTLESTRAMSAGRSGRDYGLLVEAARGIPVQFRIICDQFPKSLKDQLPENVTVLSSCYHACYFEELEQCRFVVIPLRPEDISAGQMVLLQAMAMGKPCIITETETTKDYIRDGAGMISVPPNDQAALRAALMRLCDDDTLCARLAREAESEFQNRYSMEAYARNLVTSAKLAIEAEHETPSP